MPIAKPPREGAIPPRRKATSTKSYERRAINSPELRANNRAVILLPGENFKPTQAESSTGTIATNDHKAASKTVPDITPSCADNAAKIGGI
jgi:hypothetical protein